MEKTIKTRAINQLLTLVTSILFAMLSQSARGQDEGTSEYDIRAAMVFNLTKFVEWPEAKLGAPTDAVQVCVMGTDAMTPILEKLLRGKTAVGRPIITRRLGASESAGNCHVLYVAASERKRFAEAVPLLAKDYVLTVGDQRWFTAEGGVISLPTVDDMIRIEINLGAAQRSGLVVSSKLLRLAKVDH